MSIVDTIASYFNALVFMAIGLPMFLVAILPKFKTGFFMTLGYGAAGLSLIIESVWVFNGIEPWEMLQINRLWVLQTASAFFVAYGYQQRIRKARGKHRRGSDFMHLDEMQQAQVSGGHNAQH